MKAEKDYSAASGYLAVFFILIFLIGTILTLIFIPSVPFKITAAIVLVITMFCSGGLVIVNPNESSVLVLFGAYKGTIKTNGFFWVNPFFTKKKISLRARNRSRFSVLMPVMSLQENTATCTACGKDNSHVN